MKKVIFIVAVSLYMCSANAQNWQKCEPTRILADTQADAVKATEQLKSFSFFTNKKTNSGQLVIFDANKESLRVPLIQTGQGLYNGNQKYEGYATSDNSINVADFGDKHLIIGIAYGDNKSYTIFSKCD